MLNTYIKNRGITQTIIKDNGNNHINQVNWDADYDGNIANVSLDSNTNGNKEHYVLKLNNDDLANMLNMSSVNTPIHKRLEMDFPEQAFSKMSLPESKDELVIPLTIYKRNKRPYHHHYHRHHNNHKGVTHSRRSSGHKKRTHRRKSRRSKSSKHSKTSKSSKSSTPIIDLIKNSV